MKDKNSTPKENISRDETKQKISKKKILSTDIASRITADFKNKFEKEVKNFVQELKKSPEIIHQRHCF